MLHKVFFLLEIFWYFIFGDNTWNETVNGAEITIGSVQYFSLALFLGGFLCGDVIIPGCVHLNAIFVWNIDQKFYRNHNFPLFFFFLIFFFISIYFCVFHLKIEIATVKKSDYIICESIEWCKLWKQISFFSLSFVLLFFLLFLQQCLV